MVILSPSIGGVIKDPISRYEMKKKDAELWAKEYQQNAASENSEHESIVSKIKRVLAKILGK
ncbi:hypothetical protein VFC49_10445 [Thermococcus sp. SY098]|uniref:hypothetical protein n=1 Tax=Thermococcus sp. SY098 TaxID=3111325 RepID=UPI002D7764F6|nr:hypothetical protein [Thermococcus sp. SY098]WRS52433.1 hypothetical protein VFC49_10445 [Thermococcus sp. SY098]